MWFWWLILFCDLIIPLTMIIFGYWMWKHPPKEINGIFGYRTTRSMINQDTWFFAHHYSGKLWWKIGWVLLLLSLLVHIPFYNALENTIGIFSIIILGIQFIPMIVSIILTERALKKTFTDEGIYKWFNVFCRQDYWFVLTCEIYKIWMDLRCWYCAISLQKE